jgi:hypothetical protein
MIGILGDLTVRSKWIFFSKKENQSCETMATTEA